MNLHPLCSNQSEPHTTEARRRDRDGVTNGKIGIHPLTPIDELGERDDPDRGELHEDADEELEALSEATPVRTDGGEESAERRFVSISSR